MADFSTESMEAKRRWSSKWKVGTDHTCQSTILYLMQISLQNKDEMKMFIDEQKLREFIVALNAMLVRFFFRLKKNDSR